MQASRNRPYSWRLPNDVLRPHRFWPPLHEMGAQAEQPRPRMKETAFLIFLGGLLMLIGVVIFLVTLLAAGESARPQ